MTMVMEMLPTMITSLNCANPSTMQVPNATRVWVPTMSTRTKAAIKLSKKILFVTSLKLSLLEHTMKKAKLLWTSTGILTHPIGVMPLNIWMRSEMPRGLLKITLSHTRLRFSSLFRLDALCYGSGRAASTAPSDVETFHGDLAEHATWHLMTSPGKTLVLLWGDHTVEVQELHRWFNCWN